MPRFLICLLFLTSIFGTDASEPELSETNSHERLIRRVQSAQEESFSATADLYDSYLAEHPDDADAAVERCRFLSYFAFSEDFYIEEAETRLEESDAYLDRLDFRAVVEIYRFTETWGDEVISTGEKLLKNEKLGLSDEQRALIHLQLANEYRQGDQVADYGKHASLAFSLNPEIESQLALAQFHQSEGNEEGAIDALNADFPEAAPYLSRQKIVLLRELGEEVRAMNLLKTIRDQSEEFYMSDLELARIFAGADQLEEARLAFDEAIEIEWNRDVALLEYYKFEKEKGTADTALAMYQKMRDQGVSGDPVLRYRLGLFVAHPELAWRSRDLLGLLMIGGVILVICLVPLIWVIPIHYWGLIRFRAGKPEVPVSPNWNLKHGWRISTLFLLVGSASVYLFAYESFAEYFSDENSLEIEIPDLALARIMVIDSVVLLLLMGFFIGFRRVLASFRSHWRLVKMIGIGCLVYIPIRIVASLNQQMAYGLGADLSIGLSTTGEAIHAVNEHYGAGILLISLAVITPLIEEIGFRGVLLSSFARHIPFWAANLAQSTLFMLAHDQYVMFPFLFVFGMVTGYLKRASGSVLPGVVLHAINNGIVALLVIASGNHL